MRTPHQSPQTLMTSYWTTCTQGGSVSWRHRRRGSSSWNHRGAARSGEPEQTLRLQASHCFRSWTGMALSADADPTIGPFDFLWRGRAVRETGRAPSPRVGPLPHPPAMQHTACLVVIGADGSVECVFGGVVLVVVVGWSVHNDTTVQTQAAASGATCQQARDPSCVHQLRDPDRGKNPDTKRGEMLRHKTAAADTPVKHTWRHRCSSLARLRFDSNRGHGDHGLPRLKGLRAARL